MIVRRRKSGLSSTIVQRTDGRQVETTLVIGKDAPECARSAGRRIREAMKKADMLKWNIGSGNEITIRREIDYFDAGDRYIRTRLVTASERGRDVRHSERRRLNPSYEGNRECEVCHKRAARTAKVRSDGAGRDMVVCAACRKIVKTANAVLASSRASAADASDSGGASGGP